MVQLYVIINVIRYKKCNKSALLKSTAGKLDLLVLCNIFMPSLNWNFDLGTTVFGR